MNYGDRTDQEIDDLRFERDHVCDDRDRQPDNDAEQLSFLVRQEAILSDALSLLQNAGAEDYELESVMIQLTERLKTNRNIQRSLERLPTLPNGGRLRCTHSARKYLSTQNTASAIARVRRVS